ncbi:MAG: hypothetical protein JNL79_33895 [Myxococcales bacterium]|nr:hypothetical protein [Myxococcales bacterium]
MRRALLGLFVLALVSSALVGTRGVAYWDAGDYVVLALRGGASGLLLGRPAFLLVSRGLVRLLRVLGGADAAVEPVLRWSWSVVSATAAPLLAVLGARLGLSRAAALAAGAALATSPTFAHTSHQVLTDGPALAASIGALVAATSGRVVLAGALFGLAVATRETAVAHGLAVLLLLRTRRGNGGAAVAAMVAGTVIVALVLDAHGGSPRAVVGWFSAMRRSSSAHGLAARDGAISCGWVLAMAPLAVVAGGARLRAARGELAWVVVPAAVATALLLFYPDGSFSPRYVLSTAPLALLLPAGAWLAEHRRAFVVAAALGLASVPFTTRSARAIAARGAALGPRLAALPPTLTLVPGHFCPHAKLALATLPPRDVRLVCPGWDWPEDPARTLAAALAEGRPVALDLADEAWIGPREVGPREACRAFARAHSTRVVAGFVVVER